MENRYPARARDWLTAMLFPPKCLSCQRRVAPDRLFCSKCAAKLPEGPIRRKIRLDSGAELTVLAAMSYEGGYRDSMLMYKFRGCRTIGPRMGALMAGLLDELPDRDWLASYVPLSPEGLRRRGYDQSRLMAEQIARQKGLEVKRLLEKVKKTKTQHDLGLEERQTNLLGAYSALEGGKGRSILLVDDIVTSGSTLKECASVLLNAGAWEVCGLCAAGSPGRAAPERGLEREAAGLLGWM